MMSVWSLDKPLISSSNKGFYGAVILHVIISTVKEAVHLFHTEVVQH